jgi:hypothetical protein
MSYGRRLLVHPGHVAFVAGYREAMLKMRGDLHEQHYRHLCEMSDLRKELTQARAQFEALRNAVIERQRAEANLELLKRDRDRQMSIAEGRAVWLH